MFTGIIQDLGTVNEIKPLNNGLELHIKTSLSETHLKKGNSLSVDGVCLTIESYENQTMIVKFTVVPESLNKTTFNTLKNGDRVNLELPITLQSPIGGHFVSGHVDTSAKVINRAPELKIELAKKWLRYTPQKGSITINGVSLTIASQEKNYLQISLIPETLKSTNLGSLKPGDHVNVEIDLIARYIDQLNTSK